MIMQATARHAPGRRWPAVAPWLLAACQVTTRPMHDPLYPAANEAVTYSLHVEGDAAISRVRLYETVMHVDATGVVAQAGEQLLQEWNPPLWPSTFDASFEKTLGYPVDSLVRYRFLVTALGGKGRSHEVTFAIRPYPVQQGGEPVPAPVYAQHDVNQAFDIVFVPDEGLTDLDLFREQCAKMIVDGMWHDPALQLLSPSFNYYVNPLPGKAIDFMAASKHQEPANAANLSFAEAKVIMHANACLQNYSLDLSNLMSTELHGRWTLLHELGHLLFWLADEYPLGAHWYTPEHPNNWELLETAQADAERLGKTAADVQSFTAGDGATWYKLCSDWCQMNVPAGNPPCKGGLSASQFDQPCVGMIVARIRDELLPGASPSP